MKNGGMMMRLYRYTSWLNYIIWLFEANLLLLMVNAPLIIGLFIVPISYLTIPAYAVLSLGVMPSLFAGIVALRTARERDGVVQAFGHALHAQGWTVLKHTWFVPLVVWGLITNLRLTAGLAAVAGLWWANLLLAVVVVTFALNWLLVLSERPQSFRAAAITTAKLAVVKSGRYNLNFLILLSVLVILTKAQIYLVTFGLALALLLCIVNFQSVFTALREAK